MEYGIFVNDVTKRYYENLSRHLSLGNRKQFAGLLAKKYQELKDFLTREDIDAIFDTHFYNAI